MNILFGIWRPNGPAIRRDELESMAAHTRRFAPDGEWIDITSEIGFGIQAQHTHSRSRLEVQPARDAAGNVIVYDGRLDNYRELACELDLCGQKTADSEIVLRAYERWGKECFRRLIGDWALVMWDPRACTLYLARDHAGTKLLHYSRDSAGTITWATFLDSYLNTTALDALDPVYMASYLAMLPCYRRTPYRDIQAVSPGHLLVALEKGTKEEQYWRPAVSEMSPRGSLEDHKAEFLHLLELSVERRTPPGAPVIAHLSGGRDSTSVVCIADRLYLDSRSQAPIETLSFFNDSDPAWNERPYFTLVEERRGHTGIHIDASRFHKSFNRPPDLGALYLYPNIDESTIRRDAELYSTMRASGYRAIISGIGGDEFTGGLADSEAAVAELISRGKLVRGFQQAIAWCLDRRLSLAEFSSRLVSYCGRRIFVESSSLSVARAPWLSEIARQHCLTAFNELRLPRFLPFFTGLRECGFSETWWFTLRTQLHLKPSEVYRYEYRYPYLDRDLLEFLLRLPTDELARPGRSRFLMRSALKGIVPEQILERRRKAYLLSSPLSNIRQLAPLISVAINTSVLAKEGYIDASQLQLALDRVITGKDIQPWPALYRFAALETWVQHRDSTKPSPNTSQVLVSACAHTDRVPVP